MQEIGTVSAKKQTSRKKVVLFRIVFFVSVAKNAIVVTFGIILAYYLESKNLHYLQLTGSVDGGIPHFEIPTSVNFLDCVNSYNVSILFIPLVAILETIAIAKVFCK